MTRHRRPFVLAVLTVLAAVVGLSAAPAVSAAPAYPPGTIGSASINATVFHRGDPVVVNLRNTKPGRAVMSIASPTRVLGATRVDRTFVGTVQGVVPLRYRLGSATITVNGNGGEVYVFQVTVVSG